MARRLLLVLATLFAFGVCRSDAAPLMPLPTPVLDPSCSLESFSRLQVSWSSESLLSHLGLDKINVFDGRGFLAAASLGPETVLEVTAVLRIRGHETQVLAFFDSGSWHARFFPELSGEAVVTFHAYVAGPSSSSASSAPLAFTLAPGHGGSNAAFVTLAPNEQYFATSDGKPWMPVGENACGYSQHTSNATAVVEGWLTKIAAAGGGVARVWLADNAANSSLYPFAIEKDSIGEYDMSAAKRFDSVLETAERLGIRLLVSLNDQHTYRETKRWPISPYNVASGGFLSNASQFLTDHRARNAIKARLSYIVARWGYSPNIFAWELFNEVDFVDGYTTEVAAAWHSDMAVFLAKEDQRRHLITTSFGWERGDPAVMGLAVLDFVQTHHYDNATFGGDMAGAIHGLLSLRRAQFSSSPLVIGEFGVGPYTLDPHALGLHHGLWASVVSGAAIPALSWFYSTEIELDNRYDEFTSVSNFISLVGNAWIDAHWAGAEFSATGSEALRVLALIGRGPRPQIDTVAAVLWLQDLRFQWRKVGTGALPSGAVTDAAVTATGLSAGSYEVYWVNTTAGRGNVVSKVSAVCGMEGWCTLPTAPSFVGDMAALLLKDTSS